MAPKTLPALMFLSGTMVVSWLGMPLVLAQAEPEAPSVPGATPAPDATNVPDAMAVPGSQVKAEPDPAARRPSAVRIAAPPLTIPDPNKRVAPLPPPPLPIEAPATLGLDAPERRAAPPKRFDASLDALVREGVVTPAERVRVRGSLLSPKDALVRKKACRSGALSEQECRSGVIIIGRGRQDGLTTRYGTADLPGSGGGRRFAVGATPLPPISVPVSALLSGSGGNFRLTDVFRVTPRPRPIAGNGNARLLYPLIGSAVTSSAFGWRLHPIVGSWLMHSGRDLAAPEGTPVVASLSGKVVSSGLAGGYGLAVELEHARPRRRTLYGHLSELYVKAGDSVRQGEVIGRVGSTGLSTGPHLHFELRLPQGGGWVATDPGDLDPGGTMIAGLGGRSGATGPTDAVAMLMGQLIETLERPRSPLPAKG